jgi:hypothetical protein
MLDKLKHSIVFSIGKYAAMLQYHLNDWSVKRLVNKYGSLENIPEDKQTNEVRARIRGKQTGNAYYLLLATIPVVCDKLSIRWESTNLVKFIAKYPAGLMDAEESLLLYDAIRAKHLRKKVFDLLIGFDDLTHRKYTYMFSDKEREDEFKTWLEDFVNPYFNDDQNSTR